MSIVQRLRGAGRTATNFLSREYGGLSRGLSDVLASRLYQRQIDEQNRRAAETDQQIFRRAAELKRRGRTTQAKGLLRVVQNSAAPASLERDVIGRELTSKGDVIKSAGNLAGLATMGLRTPVRIAKSIAKVSSPVGKIAAYGAVRGVENALPNVVSGVVQRKPVKEIAKTAGKDIVAGAVLNTALSPKLTIKATGEVARNTGRYYKNVAHQEGLQRYAKLFNADVAKTINRTPDGKFITPQGKEYLTRTYRQSIAEQAIRKNKNLAEFVDPEASMAGEHRVTALIDPQTKEVVHLESTDPQFSRYIKESAEGGTPRLGYVGKNPKEGGKNAFIPDPLPKKAGTKGYGSTGKKLQEPLVDNNPELNVNRLNIKPEAKLRLSETVDELTPTIKGITGKKLTNRETLETAQASSKVLEKTVGRQETLAWQAAMVKTRQQLADQAQSGTVTPEFLENLLAVKSQGTDIARKLQSLSINADPREATAMERMVAAVLKNNQDTDEILKAAQGVDFNDPKQAATFYRQFVKPKASEWLDTLRYNSMLSSPNTHINNIFSNFLQSGVVKPVEKTLSGAVDFLAHGTGKNRTKFAGEGAAYARGYWSNVRNATHSFADVMRGKAESTNLDTRNISLAPRGGMAGKVEGVLSYPMKLLEGMDQFFMTLAKGGEMGALKVKQGKGLQIATPDILAEDAARKTVFRGELGDKNEGYILNAIDTFTNKLQALRSSENPLVSTVSKFTVPFLKTPINIFKQGVEYSPAGLTTLPGNSDKVGQIAKAVVGSSVFAGAAALLGSDRLTWSEPVSEKQKNAFRAAGKQPYSVKIGSNWISYSKLGPLAFPIAMVAAIDDAEKNKKLDQSTTEQILGAVAKYGNFLADQTYAKSIGDLISAAKGGESGIARIIGNDVQQVIPYRALLGWVARGTDPYQRKTDATVGIVEKQVQQMMMQIPGLSDNVPARRDQYGDPIENQFRLLNAFSPLKVTSENQYERSPDAPQGVLDQVALYGKGLVTDPKNTLEALLTSERLRKINGDTAIFERKKGLGSLDNGDTATQVDHRLALALGGSNNPDNLQVLGATENALKGRVEVMLMKKVASGEITKAEAQERDRNWQAEVKNLSPSDRSAAQTASVTRREPSPEVKEQDGMFVATIDGVKKKYSTRSQAERAVENNQKQQVRDAFKESGLSFDIRDGIVYSLTSRGTVKTEPLAVYQGKLDDATYRLKLQEAKSSKNLNEYLSLQNAQLERLEKQKSSLDPQADAAKIISLTDKQQDILAQVRKYQSYGGFTKPKKGKKFKVYRSRISGRAPKVGRIKISTVKPTTPRINKFKLSNAKLPRVTRPRTVKLALPSTRRTSRV